MRTSASSAVVSHGAYVAGLGAREFEGAVSAMVVSFADRAADHGIRVFGVVQDERHRWLICCTSPINARSNEKVGMICYVVK